MSKLATWLTKSLTLPDIKKAIISRLKAWHANEAIGPVPDYNWPGVNDLVRNQDLVGWRVFLEGGILHDWAAKQQEYYDWLQKRNTGKRWITTLIKKLWQISWNMWEHRTEKREIQHHQAPSENMIGWMRSSTPNLKK